MNKNNTSQVTSEYRSTWGTIKLIFPAGMTEQNRQDALDEMAAWERAPKRLVAGVD
jgi:hypothetical protein